MNYEQSYHPYPQVFLVDGGGGQRASPQPPGLIPCWSFPPHQERVRRSGKSRSCMGVSTGPAIAVLLLFLLVFAALGFEAHQIFNLQNKVKEMKKVEPKTEFISPQKQIGSREAETNGEDKKIRPAAHVTGHIETLLFPRTLRWESKTGQAFVSGGVAYLIQDGALQVNETGLYHVYARVELLFRGCSPTTSFHHSVFVRRRGHTSVLTLMEAHRAGFCSHHRPGLSWTTESYLGSVHQLKKHDRVFVNVSHPSELNHSHNGNFFGLYKV